jgi:hypothetical protein
MSAIAFWFLSLRSSVRRSVRRWMRSISSGALLSNAPSPLGGRDDRAALRPIGDRRAAARGAGQLDFVHAGEADAVDLRGRALEDRGLAIDLDPTQTNSGAFGSSEIFAPGRPARRRS